MCNSFPMKLSFNVIVTFIVHIKQSNWGILCTKQGVLMYAVELYTIIVVVCSDLPLVMLVDSLIYYYYIIEI